jgi:hypothetical protein
VPALNPGAIARRAQSTALATPPGSPSNGQRWIVAASPTSAWAGQATKIAAWQDGAWAFYAPLDGWQAWDVATRRLLYWDALTGTWSVLTSTIFSDASFTWQDNGDATKQAKVELVGLTPGTTRTLGIPDGSGTIVLEGFAATLTNKTISFASNTFAGYLPVSNLPALIGDVTTPGGSAATTIAPHAVTNAKAAQMAHGTIKGRTSSGLGDPEDLSAADATALMEVFTSGLKGLAPGSGGGTTNYLRADGAWAAPSGTATIFPDTAFTIQNITTPSKQIAFDASLIAPATTRTLKAPDRSGTLALVETSLGQGILQARLQGLGAY